MMIKIGCANYLAQCLAHCEHSVSVHYNFQLAVRTVWAHQLETELSVLVHCLVRTSPEMKQQVNSH